jgi:hypothetical protein
VILTKEELIRRLDALGEQVAALAPSARKVADVTRGLDEVDTEDWCVIQWMADEEVPALMETIAVLSRDVLSDL